MLLCLGLRLHRREAGVAPNHRLDARLRGHDGKDFSSPQSVKSWCIRNIKQFSSKTNLLHFFLNL